MCFGGGRELKDPLIKAVVTPRFIPTCTPALLKGLGQLAKDQDLAVQSHISESLDEVATCLQLHPEVRFCRTFLFPASCCRLHVNGRDGRKACHADLLGLSLVLTQAWILEK